MCNGERDRKRFCECSFDLIRIRVQLQLWCLLSSVNNAGLDCFGLREVLRDAYLVAREVLLAFSLEEAQLFGEIF